MIDKDLDELISNDKNIRHTFETQGDGPIAEQFRVSGSLDVGEELSQEPDRKEK